MASTDPTQSAPRAAPTDPSAAGAPPDASGEGGEGGEGGEVITITEGADGSWSVDCGDGQPPIQCASTGDVMKAVHQCLSNDSAGDAKDAWNQEASSRGPSGTAADGPTGGAPAMTMP